jgi:hypothetical protein
MSSSFDTVALKGGPGMPEMLKPTSAIMGAGLGKTALVLTVDFLVVHMALLLVTCQRL